MEMSLSWRRTTTSAEKFSWSPVVVPTSPKGLVNFWTRDMDDARRGPISTAQSMEEKGKTLALATLRQSKYSKCYQYWIELLDIRSWYPMYQKVSTAIFIDFKANYMWQLFCVLINKNYEGVARRVVQDTNGTTIYKQVSSTSCLIMPKISIWLRGNQKRWNIHDVLRTSQDGQRKETSQYWFQLLDPKWIPQMIL